MEAGVVLAQAAPARTAPAHGAPAEVATVEELRMVMLLGFVLRSTSGTKDLDIKRLYDASKCSLRLYKAAMIKQTVEWFCELRSRHATGDGGLRFSDVIWLSTNFKSCWQVLC